MYRPTTTRFFLLFLITFTCGIMGVIAIDHTDPRVVLNIGEILGKVETFSSDFLTMNRKVAVYQGIPYAEPPVGAMRFKLPVGKVSWEGTYFADDMPPGCPQVIPDHLKHLDSTEMKTENCLFLNVFVPLPTPVNASVMVFIHGGQFEWGNGLSYPADPLPLAAFGNVIIVTMNYRLGIFGFLSTGDDVIQPNLGLHDQRAALKWVHDNIEAFGGDSNKVTLFGNEAGAVSVGWHVLSPLSRRFFQRAILQSGNPFSEIATFASPEDALIRANTTAALLGCSFAERKTKESIRQCLMETHVDDLVSVGSQVGAIMEVRQTWQPIHDNGFFTKSVEELIKDGGFGDIDVIIGVNKDEGSHRLLQLTDFPINKPFIYKKTFENSVKQLDFGRFESDILGLLYAKEDFTFDDDSDYFDILSGIITDTTHLCSAKQLASTFQTAGCKVYMYVLTHEPLSQTVLKYSWTGAGYLEDLKYVFGLPFQTDLPFPIPEIERVVSAHFMRLWANFAKTGDPNTSGDPTQPKVNLPEWQEYSKSTENYKMMNANLTNGIQLQTRECYTWSQVIPKLRESMVELKSLRDTQGENPLGEDTDGSNKKHDEL